MNVLSKLPFDIQEHILVKIMKLYKLRQGKYIRQIDKDKYKFLDYITRHYINKNSSNYYRFYIKNLYDDPIRNKSRVENDMVDVRIYYDEDNTYHYEISIYRLRMKNDENNFTPEKMRKDIYHKGPLSDNYFWDFFEFSYEVK